MGIQRRIIILDKMKDIEYSVNLVKENLPSSLEDFRNLGLVKDGIMKRMEFIIQNVIDICAVISSDMKLEKPHSEDDIIENLGKANVLNSNLVKKIREMKGLRNILVHRYGKINDDEVYESVNNDLDDVEEFLGVTRKLLSDVQ